VADGVHDLDFDLLGLVFHLPGCAGEAADDFVGGGDDGEEGPAADSDDVQDRQEACEKGVAGVACPGGGDADAEEDDPGEGDCEDVGRSQIDRLWVAHDRVDCQDEQNRADELPGQGGSGVVGLMFEQALEAIFAMALLENLRQARSRGETDGGERGAEQHREGRP